MNTYQLRQYQQDGVEALRGAYRSGKTAPLYVLPTGGGKTAVFSYVAESAVARGKRVTILVHRHELLMQASRSLERLGVSHGILSPRFAQSRDPVQVASVATLVRRLDRVTPPDLLIIDEAHHATAGTYRKVIEAYPEAHLLGVTATPVRGDGQGLGSASGGIFDDMIQGPSIAELIRDGFLVQPEVYAPPVGIDLTGVHRRMGDYDKRELGERIDKPTITGDVVDHYTRHCAGIPAIAFCVSIAHAEHVANSFRQRGINALRVDGGMEDSARRGAIDGLGSGSVSVLTSADLIGEGVDLPRVGVAILLRPTYSTALYLQQVGRALRPYPGKTRALVLDHVGNTMRHGFPDDERGWQLNPGASGNSRHSREDGGVKITQCRACYFVFEIGPAACPSCRAEIPAKDRQIKVTEGELKKLERAEVAARQLAHRREQGSARSLEDLIKLGKAKGYHPKWAEKVFAGRTRR